MDKLIKRNVVGNARGMSIMEILIALTLIGLASTFVVGKLFENLNDGKIQTTKIQIRKLGERLDEFRRHCNTYPTSDQGLDALINKPSGGKECKRYQNGGYLKDSKIPQDPWDTEYLYESDGKKYNIKSLGGDGMEGGDGVDADISTSTI
jgi:general secretion pathway protein G